jgi:hypothetical protein
LRTTDKAPGAEPTTATTALDQLSESVLYDLLNSPTLSLIERQPIYMELRAREDKKKSLARIAAMKDKKAAKDNAS